MNYSAFVKADVQCGHFVALYFISDKQKGQVFVSGSAGTAFPFSSFTSLAATFSRCALLLSLNLLTALIITNNTKATIKKLITAVKNNP